MHSQIESLLQSDHVELDVLLTDALVALESARPDHTYRALDLFWARLAMHIRAEHLHLFPAVIQSAGSREDLAKLIQRLRADHNFFMHELIWAIKAVRTAVDDEHPRTPASVVERMRNLKTRLVDHNAIEETRIYNVLSTETGRDLVESLKAELDNLPPRFAAE